VTPQPAHKNNIVQVEQDEQNVRTPLYPFKCDTTTWYDSNITRQTQPFGYQYPETEGFTYPISEPAREKLQETLTEMYPTPARLLVMSRKGLASAEATLLPKAALVHDALLSHRQQATAFVHDDDDEIFPADFITSPLPPRRALKDLISPTTNTYPEYLINLRAEKHALGGSYSVCVFLGPPPDASPPSTWHLSPLFVGSFYPFGQEAATTGCGKCRAAQRTRVEVTGQIPLTMALMERFLVGDIEGLGRGAVVEYLKRNLHWRVRKVCLSFFFAFFFYSLLFFSIALSLSLFLSDLILHNPSVSSWPHLVCISNPNSLPSQYFGGENIKQRRKKKIRLSF
jgi:tyrosinase